MPEYNDFWNELLRMMAEGIKAGNDFIEVNAGELHRRVGDYPDPKRHRMPVCCAVMGAMRELGDVIIMEPPGGQGASLTIRYMLPRQEHDSALSLD